MSIEVSIVMISYNKYPQNLLSLYALENQTFDPKKMEVILVDDASTDETDKLRSYRPRFKFTYIRCKNNVGRSEAKNIGVNASRGSLLVIMDSEMILDPEYVQQHYQLHQAKENLVVTSCFNHYGTFTILEKNYNEKQLKKINELHRDGKFHKIPVMEILKQKKKTQLYSKTDIQKLKYKRTSFHTPFFRSIIKQFGSRFKGFYMPYIFVITHCISLKKSTFDLVGPFSNQFKGWGCEDWEFGYRLYKHGVKIVDNPKVNVYHQEHPRSLVNQNKDKYVNYRLFFKLHTEFDVGVQSLCWIDKNMFEANELIIEYNSMVKQYEGKLNHLEQGFNKLFDTILALLIKGKPVENLLHHSGLKKQQDWIERLNSEIQTIADSNQYPKLLSTLKWLLNK